MFNVRINIDDVSMFILLYGKGVSVMIVVSVVGVYGLKLCIINRLRCVVLDFLRLIVFDCSFLVFFFF